MKHKFPYIIFEVTNECNLTCFYCYNIWKRPVEAIENLNSYNKGQKTLKKLFRIADIGNITFTGGEPTLAERLPELVLFCRMKKASVNLITNGQINDEKYYRELISLGVSNFELPLNSFNPLVHDKMTGKLGSHEKVVNSINVLKSLDANVVTVIVLTKMNIAHIFETLKFIKSLEVERIMLTRFNIGGEGIKNARILMPEISELKNCFSIANEASKSLNLKITSNVCTPLCILNPEDYDNISTMSCSASIKNMPVTLDINGNMRICNHSPVIIGNIFNDKIENILNSDYVNSWKEIKPEYCKECEVYENCFGACRAASEQLGLGLNHADPILELRGTKL